ncbi:MAG: hypothetical protein GXP26_12970 [Planctomycetes bacterium]|nr:hypothetical protein [Planctomycetota bacterium]
MTNKTTEGLSRRSLLLAAPAIGVGLAWPWTAASASPDSHAPEIRDRISPDDIAWIRKATETQLRGSRIKGAGGLWMHTPDGVGNYAALWVRDFEYMVEYAGDLLDPKEIKASILYLLGGQRDDGCIPDRVNKAGVAVYAPGGENNQFADHALDNNMFMAKMVCSYVDLTDDVKFFRQVEPALRKALDHTQRADNGLVYNSPDDLLCQYGFTDCIGKTGHLLFCSVLYFDACQQMERWCRKSNCGEPEEYQQRAALIRKNLSLLWNNKEGMFWAADQDCKQIDIWGSALAAEVGCTTEKQADRIADYLIKHYDGIVEHGQIRHLPAEETWQRFMPAGGVAPGQYQNGAFWGTPIAWVAPTIARRDLDLAVKMVSNAIADYRKRGITECINGDYHNVPEYVVSATNVYGLVRGL